METVETPTPSLDDDFQGVQVVLILCGLIASGKSSFAQCLQDHFPQFRRCNQDDLGDRRRVEHLARDSLRRGLSVCVDRTNFNASQRSYWINIAREFPGTSIWVIVFDTPYEICAARLKERTSHPTIKDPEQGLTILTRFAADFVPPVVDEGYDRIISIKPSDHTSAVYSRSAIVAILQRLRESPSVSSRPFRGSSRQGTVSPPGDRNWMIPDFPTRESPNPWETHRASDSSRSNHKTQLGSSQIVGVYGNTLGKTKEPGNWGEVARSLATSSIPPFQKASRVDSGLQGTGTSEDPITID